MHLLPYEFLSGTDIGALREEGICKFLMLRTHKGLRVLFFPIAVIHTKALHAYQNGGQPIGLVAGGACDKLDVGMPRPFFGSSSCLDEFGYDRPPDQSEHWIALDTIRRTMEEAMCSQEA